MGSASSSPRSSQRDTKYSASKENKPLKMKTRNRRRRQTCDPLGPPDSKSNIFQAEHFVEIDEVAKLVSASSLHGDFCAVAAEVCQAAGDDLGRARAIFTWLTALDVAAVADAVSDTPEPGTVIEAVLHIHWKLSNHAHLYARLCRAIDVPCVVISGVNKSAAYQLGGPVEKDQLGGQWNAVCLDGHWHLVDAFWASMCIPGPDLSELEMDCEDEDRSQTGSSELSLEDSVQHCVNEFYFLTDPEELIYTHFPDREEWQLLEEPMSKEEFAQNLYVGDRFFQVGLAVSEASEDSCIVTAPNGKANIVFGLEKDRHRSTKFGYMIYVLKQSLMEKLQAPMERYVFYSKYPGNVSYNLRLPFGANYRMDVFGLDKSKHQRMAHVFSYLVNCENPAPDCQPYPDCPEIGWGPGEDCDSFGLSPISHEGPCISGDVIEVQFNMQKKLNVVPELKSSNTMAKFSTLCRVLTCTKDNKLLIKSRLSQRGEYGLKLYVSEQGQFRKLENVCNYMVNNDSNEEGKDPFPSIHDGVLGTSYLCADLGITTVSSQGDILQSQDGTMDLKFTTSQQGTDLFCEVTHINIDETTLSDCVFKTAENSVVNFSFSFPEPGEFGVNVYARKEEEGDCLYHIYSCLCQSNQTEVASDLHRRTREIPIDTIVTEEENTTIRLPQSKSNLLAELRRHLAAEPANQCVAKMQDEGEEEVCVANLPKFDKYILTVFTEHSNGTVTAIKQNHLWRTESDRQMSAAPQRTIESSKHRKLRKQLKAASKARDLGLLNAAIADFEENKVANRGDLTQAKKVLLTETLKDELRDAMSARRLTELERTIRAVEEARLTEEIGVQLKTAKEILHNLYLIELYRRDIVNLEQKTFSEVRSYKVPPQSVFRVMRAIYTILGEKKKDIQDWVQIQALMGRSGADSLQRLIGEFRVERLSFERAQLSKAMVKGLDLAAVKQSSAGSAAIFVWANCMIQEAESRHVQRGEDLFTVNTTAKSNP